MGAQLLSGTGEQSWGHSAGNFLYLVVVGLVMPWDRSHATLSLLLPTPRQIFCSNRRVGTSLSAAPCGVGDISS